MKFRYLLPALVLVLMLCASLQAQIAPFQGAPLCLTHDNRAYHGLWDSVRGCHYDHHHGADPHSLDDVFGTEIYTLMGGEGPGHPWQTFSAAGTENELKHKGHQWYAPRNVGNGSTIPTFRLLMHQHSELDAGVQFHSYALEMELINPDGSLGTLRAVGWTNTGDLVLDGSIAIDADNNEPGRHKQHSVTGSNQIWYSATMATRDPIVRANGSIQYPRFLTISTSTHNAWGGTQSTAPFLSDLDFCTAMGITDPTRCRLNATTYRPHLIGFDGIGTHPVFSSAQAILDPDGDGWIDGTFFHDRYGVPRPTSECNEIGLDCAPYTYRHVWLRGGQGCNDTTQCGQLYTSYDVLFGNRTAGWNSKEGTYVPPPPPPDPEPEPVTLTLTFPLRIPVTVDGVNRVAIVTYNGTTLEIIIE